MRIAGSSFWETCMRGICWPSLGSGGFRIRKDAGCEDKWNGAT